MSFNKITKPLSKNPKILTVASLPKEGKTTAFAGIKDVLIVDCDADDGLNYIDPAMIGNEPSYYQCSSCLLYTSPSPRARTRSRMPSSA